MTRQTKRVLLIEDEQPMAVAIMQGLKRSARIDFQVTHLAHLNRETARSLRGQTFDLAVIDLQLQEGGTSYWGLLPVYTYHQTSPRLLIVVYSAHATVPNVVKAMRLGATDFISKADCAPQELPARLERLFDDERQLAEALAEQDRAFSQHGEQWQKEHAGQAVAVVGDRVVAKGSWHLEALVDYAEKRAEHPEWPEVPNLIEVPAE